MFDLPNDFIIKYKNLLGKDSINFFNSFYKNPYKGFRLNPLKNKFNELNLSKYPKIPFIKYGYYGSINGNSLEHKSGYIYSQDISAMYVGEVVNAKPGDKILDLCASPGGKSTHIAGQLLNRGILVSNEINYKRSKILVENLERFGAKNAIILNENTSNIAQNFEFFFDKVLVDAPCSGEGMFRKNHTAIKYWNINYPAYCAVRQKMILRNALNTLKYNGELIYSTCTFAPEENEGIVEWILEEYPYLALIDIPKYEGMDSGNSDFINSKLDLSKTVRLMPHHFKGEGQFIAKFKNTKEKVGYAIKHHSIRINHSLNKLQFNLWNRFISDISNSSNYFLNISKDDFKVFNNHLYLYPKEWPNIFEMKFMRPGLYLGMFKKDRFEPSYSLALSINPQSIKKIIECSKNEYMEYLHGLTINIKSNLSNGWYLLTCNGIGFSFGKLVNGSLKNFIPKNIRIK